MGKILELNAEITQTELGTEASTCARYLGEHLAEYGEVIWVPQLDGFSVAALRLDAQWKAFRLALKQIYGKEYSIVIDDEGYGARTDDGD